jgi:hypothetical protein
MARGKKACRCGKQGNIGLFGGQTQSTRGGKADHFSVETIWLTGISLRIIMYRHRRLSCAAFIRCRCLFADKDEWASP